MMRCLRFASIIVLLVLFACNKNPYRKLSGVKANNIFGNNYFSPGPEIEAYDRYRCIVDGRFLFKRFHLSGLLLFQVEGFGSGHSIQHAIFQNEMGITFFHFKWGDHDSFSVVQIIKQFDKPAIINTLRTDLSLLLIRGFHREDETEIITDKDTLACFPINNGFAYFRLDEDKNYVTNIEYARKSRITSIAFHELKSFYSIPDSMRSHNSTTLYDSIRFKHYKANFTIVLKKIKRDEN